MAFISAGHPLYERLTAVFTARGLLYSRSEIVLADVELDLAGGVVHYEVAPLDESGALVLEGGMLALEDRHVALSADELADLNEIISRHYGQGV